MISPFPAAFQRLEKLGRDDRRLLEMVSWSSSSFATSPTYLETILNDHRWQIDLWAALIDDQPIAVVAAMEPTSPLQVQDPDLDLSGLFETFSSESRAMYLGNPIDLSAGVAFDSRLDSQAGSDFGKALVAAVVSAARSRGVQTAALHIGASDLDALAAGFAEEAEQRQLGERFSFEVQESSLDKHIASQRSSVRQLMRRDLRGLEQSGLKARVVAASEVIQESATLVAAVKANHDVLDHPRLAEYRLRRWAAWNPTDCIAFTVRGADDELVAVTFGVRRDAQLELYEVGLNPNSDLRHLGYLEALVYSPLRFAIDNALPSVGLGTGSSTPKKLRGAVAEITWGLLSAS